MFRVLVIATLLLGGARAWAEPASDATVDAFFDVGRQRYAAGDYAEALAEFQAGYDATHEPAFLVNVGQCLRGLDRIDEAAMAYKQFLDLRSGDSRLRGEVWEALDELLAELEGRLFRVARSAMFLRAYLDSGLGTLEERIQARERHSALIAQLVRVDDTLTLGLGRVHLLQIPDPKALGFTSAPANAISRTTP
jgi:tetratricopeptide (TPR) repeat protein